MEITEQILRDKNELTIYFIDLKTGMKAEVYSYANGTEILLLRDEIEKEDIERASSKVDLTTLKDQKRNDNEDIESLKKITKQIEKGILLKEFPKLQSVEFHVGSYKRITYFNHNITSG